MKSGARGVRWHIGFVLAALVAACSAPPPQKPAQAAPAQTAPSAQASAPAPAPAPSAAPSATAAAQNTIVIHEADLFGEIESRTGTTIHVLPLVATRTPPAVGVKGVLLRGVEEGGNTEWLPIADVTVKKEPDERSNLQLTITDEKRDALIGGKKVNHFAKGVRVKFRWEY